MTVCVFLGPTLGRAAARGIWAGATYLPPVRQGEVYAAARRGARAIGIVDGYFDGVPAVWHKEILWAMRQGIPVFGASSMGALRAAELAAFGMRGVGEVFASLRRGEWEDDDEVAIVHGPAELGYPRLSEAMVDIRATVERARETGVLDADTARRLLGHAKARHYRERSYARLQRDAAGDAAIDAATLDAFLRWLPTGRVERKAGDAAALLVLLRERFGSQAGGEAGGEAGSNIDRLAGTPVGEHGHAPGPSARDAWRFEHTDAWQRVVERAPVEPPDDSAEALALGRLKLDGTWRACARAALLRQVLSCGSGRPLETPAPGHLAHARDMLRRTHALWRADAFADWKRANGLDERSFAELLDSEARVRRAAASAPSLDEWVVRELQARGEYARHLEEAERVRLTLLERDAHRHERAAEVDPPTLPELLAAAGLELAPEAVADWAEEAGFADIAALRRALLHHRPLARTDGDGTGPADDERRPPA